jgi:hypothetical protein
MSRGNQILAAILVAQIALAVLVFWPREASVAAGEPLFAGLEADQVVGLAIRDDTGQELQLAKGADGWVLADAGDYPVKPGAVPELLEKVVALQTGRLVAETRASHERLEVAGDAYAYRVELELEDGTVHTLYLGSTPSYGTIHVRVEGQDPVYLVSDLSSTDVMPQLSSWIDTSYFSVPPDQIVALTLENANGTFELVKDGDGWTMAGLAEDETLDTAGVDALINQVSSVRMMRPLGTAPEDAYGIQEPSAVLAIHALGEEGTAMTYMLHVGAQSEEDKSYVLKSSESPYYIRVAEYVAQDWVDKDREGFLAEPPTPEPTE